MQSNNHARLPLASEYCSALLTNPRLVVRFEARFFMINTHTYFLTYSMVQSPS